MKPVEVFIIQQPEPYQSIILYLISEIKKIVPHATLEYKYGIPYFYVYKKPLCYVAPNQKKKYVDLGFSRGFQLKSNLEYLVSENRNTVKSLRYFTLEEINITILEAVVKEASMLY